MGEYLVGVNPEGKREPIHRIVAEKYLGRKLKPRETVHHIDEDKENNCITNLIVFESNEDHISYHKFHRRGNNLLPRIKNMNYSMKEAKEVFHNRYGIILYGPFYKSKVKNHASNLAEKMKRELGLIS